MSDTTTGLECRVGDAIEDNPQLACQDLDITAHDGTVILNGVVGSYYQKQIAQETVWTVQGVSAVENQLIVPRRPK